MSDFDYCRICTLLCLPHSALQEHLHPQVSDSTVTLQFIRQRLTITLSCPILATSPLCPSQDPKVSPEGHQHWFFFTSEFTLWSIVFWGVKQELLLMLRHQKNKNQKPTSTLQRKPYIYLKGNQVSGLRFDKPVIDTPCSHSKMLVFIDYISGKKPSLFIALASRGSLLYRGCNTTLHLKNSLTFANSIQYHIQWQF